MFQPKDTKTQSTSSSVIFAQTDVWDTLGTNQVNITKDVAKWHLDDKGQQQTFHGRNLEQKKVKHQHHEESLDEIVADIAEANGGELHSKDLSPNTVEAFYRHHPVAFVDYFAPWCIWCQRLMPTWEKFAQEVHTRKLKVGVGKVDCVLHAQLCMKERIMAFPTLRWVEHGRTVLPEHQGDRTVAALVEYATRRLASAEGGDGAADDDYDYGEREFHQEYQPGCRVSGRLMVNRVPGNLHISASSPNHVLHADMTNLTHRVHELSFGTPGGPKRQPDFIKFFHFFTDNTRFSESWFNPMADKLYPSKLSHMAFHHHMKVVTSFMAFAFINPVYHILEESQVLLYDDDEVPEIKFLWDMSPVSINMTEERKPWYEYLTSLLAIIGGTYTTLGLINATLLKMFKPKTL